MRPGSPSGGIPAIWLRLKEEGTGPERPLEHLFVLYDMRIIGAHAVGDRQQKLAVALERFGIDPDAAAGGFGRALDIVYDRLAEQLASVCRKLAAALGTG
jgi:hypothetical protein